MGAKNSLTAVDAGLVEDAFRSKVAAMEMPSNEKIIRGHPQDALSPMPSQTPATSSATAAATGIASTRVCSQSVNRGGIATKPISSSSPRKPAWSAVGNLGYHLGFAQPRALSRKVSVEFAVPLCRTHHREVHRCGNEIGWWNNFGLDPLTLAAALWAQTRPLVRARALPPNDEQLTDPRTNGSDPRPVPQLGKQRRNRKTKSINATGAQ
jgi:hypothetical protein